MKPGEKYRRRVAIRNELSRRFVAQEPSSRSSFMDKLKLEFLPAMRELHALMHPVGILVGSRLGEAHVRHLGNYAKVDGKWRRMWNKL